MSDYRKEIIPLLSTQFDVNLDDNWEAFYNMLVAQLDYLINHNMERLMDILYRIDIDETKAFSALSQPEAAKKLADLIVERQIQKWKSRTGIV